MTLLIARAMMPARQRLGDSDDLHAGLSASSARRPGRRRRGRRRPDARARAVPRGRPHGQTPRRLAQAFAELLTPGNFDLTTFANAEGYDDLVLVKDIPVQSVCEHHLLPFVGVAQSATCPRDRILGLSKFARIVDLFARRPQTQERLTKQVAGHLTDTLAPRVSGS